MTDFEYLCIDASGKEQKGSITALSLNDAKSRLKDMGLTVIDLVEKEGKRSKKQFSFRKRITETDIYSLSKELSVLLKAGITIDKAMEILIGSTANTVLGETLQQILGEVKGGKKLSQSFEDTKKFSPLVIVMIKIGEGVGDIRSAFENVAQYMHFQIQFKNEIRNAMAYPLFLIFASAATLLVIFKVIVPRFFSIFGDETASLPLVSRVLYSISNNLNFTNLIFFLIVVGIIILSVKLLKVKNITQRLYSFLVYVPFFKNLIIYLELSRFSYSMYTMLKSGVEFINALTLSASIIQNSYIRTSIERTINQIKKGKSIADVFTYISFLPPIMHVMLKVGETSGNLKDIFLELHSVFDERFKNFMKRVLLLLEPTVITITGIIVGIIVISLLLTVMSVSDIKL